MALYPMTLGMFYFGGIKRGMIKVMSVIGVMALILAPWRLKALDPLSDAPFPPAVLGPAAPVWRGGFWLSGDYWIGFRFRGLDSSYSQ